MKAYHYTKLENWFPIKNGSGKTRGVPGLAATKRLGSVNPKAYEAGAVFCLPAPRPESWTDNKHFPDAWNNLTASVGALLLEVDIEGLEPAISVVDWAFMEGFLNDAAEGPYASSTRVEAEGRYAESARPLDDLLQRPASFSLPELTIRRHIDFDRITLAEDQSHLAASLREYRPGTESLAYGTQMIANIPGLAKLL